MKVFMLPNASHMQHEASGVATVIRKYTKYFPEVDIQLEYDPYASFDVYAVHAGMTAGDVDVSHCHGLYFTGDYQAASWEYKTNIRVIEALRGAKQVTVPSRWIAEVIERDMRFSPHVIGHGVEPEEWTEATDGKYVLWNKNRIGDVCDPTPVRGLAEKFPKHQFVTTFAPEHAPKANVTEIGVQPYEEMRKTILGCGVYLATTKETFGIGILEAMAAGKPILGYRHGGVCDLVKHGVHGYLAEPDNIVDLCAGLDYCFKHRRTLGVNGRERAKEFSWLNVVSQVASVYRLATQKEDASVSVVIPCFNYASKVGRAIESALGQTHQVKEVIVVDDGSTDKSADAIQEWCNKDPRVRLIQQPNAGVANARNNGIWASSGTYIVCLDADDAIDPKFVEACLPTLANNRTMGIAYTGITAILPNGSEKLSEWPGRCDYDAQLAGRNQVPTCCMMRRTMLERMGGYRQRYAPNGAGAEDAELWLRCMLHGWKAEKASEQGLFIYSQGTGRVSSDPNNVAWRSDLWLGWHPSVKDKQHPFACTARAEHSSHPVRAYDRPTVSVVIPVGPGHEQVVINALDSLESQTYRNWEAIVVCDTPKPLPEPLLKAYPYVKWLRTEGPSRGAGHARNCGVKVARAPLITFLDADDHLYPDFLKKMLEAHAQSGHIVFCDYVGRATIKDVDDETLAPDIKAGIKWRDDNTGETIVGFKAAPYQCARAVAKPDPRKTPYIICNISSLLPKAWHEDIGGFDEKMPSWEDVDYWLRMAWAGRCFTHVPEELLFYRLDTGRRRNWAWYEDEATACLNAKSLVKYICGKYDTYFKKGKIMACGSCGKKPTVKLNEPVTAGASDADERLFGNPGVNPRNFVMVEFIGGIADQPVGRSRVVAGLDYGYASNGKQFLMHIEDAKLWPDKFKIIDRHPWKQPESVRIEAETVSRPLPPPPDLVTEREGFLTRAEAAEKYAGQEVVVELPKKRGRKSKVYG